ncbi:MAG: hypothetical protein AAFX99_28015 [Myxococcota bacterium]
MEPLPGEVAGHGGVPNGAGLRSPVGVFEAVLSEGLEGVQAEALGDDFGPEDALENGLVRGDVLDLEGVLEAGALGHALEAADDGPCGAGLPVRAEMCEDGPGHEGNPKLDSLELGGLSGSLEGGPAFVDSLGTGVVGELQASMGRRAALRWGDLEL